MSWRSPKRLPFLAPIDTRDGIPLQHRGHQRVPSRASAEHDYDAEAQNSQRSIPNPGLVRKKTLVKPEREVVDLKHRLRHYREHAVEDHMDIQASATGNRPAPVTFSNSLQRGKSLLIRELAEHHNADYIPKEGKDHPPLCCLGDIAPGPKDCWMIYCYIITLWIPVSVIRKVFKRVDAEGIRAFREKMGIVAIVSSLMAIVGFVTFGFTQTVCGDNALRIPGGQANLGSLVINGYDYDFSTWRHPETGSLFNGSTSPLWMDQYNAGGMDASFLFQKVNQHCLGVITPAEGSRITTNGDNMGWYFACNLHDQNDTSVANTTNYGSDYNCHPSQKARDEFDAVVPTAKIFYTWDRVADTEVNLAAYKDLILDFNLLRGLDSSQVKYPALFDTLKNRNASWAGKDISALVERANATKYADCLVDIIQVGFVDSMTIGCFISNVVLYVSLIFILGAVLIKFFMAVAFGWFLSWRLGNFNGMKYQDRIQRAKEIESWTEDMPTHAPEHLMPDAPVEGKQPQKKVEKRRLLALPTKSRFSQYSMPRGNLPSRPSTMMSQRQSFYSAASRPVTASDLAGVVVGGSRKVSGSQPPSPIVASSTSSAAGFGIDPNDSSLKVPFGATLRESPSFASLMSNPDARLPLSPHIIAQPKADDEPHGYPLVHSICLVTAYSESIDGLRQTLDSLATTDYPNSHKVILVIADGMVRGSKSDKEKAADEAAGIPKQEVDYTPNLVLSMMKDLVQPADEVVAQSCVAIADGQKQHNMCKVFSGFYDYGADSQVEDTKQQRVPMVLVAKVGNPSEAGASKAGNRGKRDSQVLLMKFLQRVMFHERMTAFEYEFFNSLWRVTGVTPDMYETALCVDADTVVFPDSLQRMNACMVNDLNIMGLCGETKIANKAETWVTMIQVFEYYISHHLTKAFESVFGGVTCLPGCFSMYRIKTPKGNEGYWVPVLANPDICEHYSENVVNTLHKKNLLLLGEDRYLSTLMLKTFPKRKMIFCPQAVCKTQVPAEFIVLLSQRRRWINSTVHNLFELAQVRDLCGTFCFSMQFVVFMDLVGTLVLPAAISFTMYIIIVSIIPEDKTGIPRPVISLVLLAFILGLPGLLIVITSRKVAYVGWMLLYLLSLPIWNLVLPAYAYWHMDDFSWGATRVVAGEGKGDGKHGEKEGEFDASVIVWKKWEEFEADRRWAVLEEAKLASPGSPVSPVGSSRSGNQPFDPSRDLLNIGRLGEGIV
ncbi:hypothetical protein L202_05311 [Cryptococcus amylolentus CBS 6039]|uniref:chitin synthase n=1 Tax=Cryptococcus amylolentus CBS 6039 TaxID=1295533 RepID=A0A1E3HK15_9TREE|nr:hypothetical protein L202_05311 [Cryptococcus amylolentus CBS 6039]ODN76669.1 hypothetical protein L202_05311 [Cryptococcus amylolentus CBS 6039]